MLEILCLQVRAPHNSGVLSPSLIFTWTAGTINAFEIYVEILAIGFHENMKLGDKTPEQWEGSFHCEGNLLCCLCKPDNNKFSSSSNTVVVIVFPL